MKDKFTEIREALAVIIERGKMQGAPWFQDGLRDLLKRVDELLELPALAGPFVTGPGFDAIVAERDKLNDDNFTVREQAMVLTRERDELQRDLTNRHKHIAELRAELAEKANALTIAGEEISKQAQEIIRLKEERELARTELENAIRSFDADHRRQLDEEIERLKAELVGRGVEIDVLADRAKGHDAWVKRTMQELWETAGGGGYIPPLTLNQLKEHISTIARDLEALRSRFADSLRVSMLEGELADAKKECERLQAQWAKGEADDKPIVEALIELSHLFSPTMDTNDTPRIIRMAIVSVQQCREIGDILEGCAEHTSSTKWVETGITLSAQVEKLVEYLFDEIVKLKESITAANQWGQTELDRFNQLHGMWQARNVEFQVAEEKFEAMTAKIAHMKLKLKRAAKLVRALFMDVRLEARNNEFHTLQRFKLEDQITALTKDKAQLEEDNAKALRTSRINDIAASASLRALDELATALAKLRTEALAGA